MERLLRRFCEYVKIETTASEESDTYPTSSGQLELGKMLTEELKGLGLADAQMSEFGVVTATVPPTTNKEGAVIAWLAHMDTSPEASGKDVKPIVHKEYDGADIVLPGDTTKVIKVDDNPELAKLVGKTIITADGTTLLGADDKAGVAAIMEAVERLMADPSIQHGPIRICFTPDEEVGRGTEHVDIEQIGAVAAYTLDGEDEGMIENETFSADMATVTIKGINIHPALAKDKMVNAIRVASEFVARMPWQTLSPETTHLRQPFLHPYTLKAGVDGATLRVLLRSFDTPDLAEQAELLKKIAATLKAEHPRVDIDVAITKQYRNMGDALRAEPRAVDLVARAMRGCGIEPEFDSVRGGTDGSRLTEMGLPTPNLSVGMHSFHSPLEWACLEQMATAVGVLIQLAQEWKDEKP